MNYNISKSGIEKYASKLIKMKIRSAFLFFFAAFSFFFRLLDAVGTPDWDEILADGLDTGGINSPERKITESRSADNPIQHPSMTKTITKKTKRVLSQDPQLIARRKREMQWKQDNPLLYKQRAEIKAQKRKERRALQPKLIRIKKGRKPNKERYNKMMNNLKVDGNEAKLQNFRNRRSNENKRYYAKLKEEVEDGTATEERKRIYEKRIRPAKQRKKFSLPQQHQNSQNDPKDGI